MCEALATMVRLELLGVHDLDPVVAYAPRGERVVDACDEARAPIPFSCRSATCGTCRVRVVEGARLVRRADSEEVAFLRAASAGEDERLACRLVLDADDGLLRIIAIHGKS